jgi:hypothetical protein
MKDLLTVKPLLWGRGKAWDQYRSLKKDRRNHVAIRLAIACLVLVPVLAVATHSWAGLHSLLWLYGSALGVAAFVLLAAIVFGLTRFWPWGAVTGGILLLLLMTLPPLLTLAPVEWLIATYVVAIGLEALARRALRGK